MRVVIIGQQWLAAEALKLCLARGDEILKAIPPAPKDGKPDRLHEEAEKAGIRVEFSGPRLEAEAIPPGTDLILAAHVRSFITTEARAATKYGSLGYHPSLLPRHRGRDAIRWAIHMRETITGGSAYWMDDGADTGPIAAQEFCHIRPGDDALTLWQRELGPLGIKLFGKVLGELDQGIVTAIPQLEEVATWEPSFSSGAKLSAK